MNNLIERLDHEYELILRDFSKSTSEPSEEIFHVSEIGVFTGVKPQAIIPQSNPDQISLIKEFVGEASRARYLNTADPEAILANLIAQLLSALNPQHDCTKNQKDFLSVLATQETAPLDSSLKGFEFYENNPYRTKAEKRLAKLKKKRK